jgi:hypothetical protein
MTTTRFYVCCKKHTGLPCTSPPLITTTGEEHSHPAHQVLPVEDLFLRTVQKDTIAAEAIGYNPFRNHMGDAGERADYVAHLSADDAARQAHQSVEHLRQPIARGSQTEEQNEKSPAPAMSGDGAGRPGEP